MDVNMNATVSATAALASQSATGVSVLKKAVEAQAQSVLSLINALPQPERGGTNLPAHLGQNVNTTA